MTTYLLSSVTLIPLQTLATVTPPDDLIGPTPDDFGGDDVVGILQDSFPSTNHIIKAIDRHILNGMTS